MKDERQMPLRALGLHPVLAYNVLLLAAIWLGSTLCYRFYEALDVETSPRMRALAQKYLFTYLLGHSPRYFQENFAGKLGQKVKQAGQATVSILNILGFEMVRVAMLMLVGGVLMFRAHAEYALVLAVWAVLYLGIVVSLAHAEPQEAAADVAPAGVFHRTTNAITDGGTTDNYQVSYHGQTVAHIDTWCHFFENGQMYNGVPVQGNLNAEKGCIKGSIMNWKNGITTRAVGMIVSPHQAEEILEKGQADQIALARAFLDSPRWGWHAADALGVDLKRPPQYDRARKALWPGEALKHR